MDLNYFSVPDAVCSECGRGIQKNYRFCPWCGNACNHEREIINFADHLETARCNKRKERLEKDSEQLEILEKELNILVLEAQLAR